MKPVLLAFFFITSMARADSPEAIAVDAAVVDRMVLERNDHVRGAQRSVEASAAKTGFLGRSYLPRVRAGVGGEFFRTGGLSPMTEPFGDLSAEINLFRSGRDGLEEDIREQSLSVAQADADDVVQDELKKARQKYWTLIYQQGLASLVRDALERNGEASASANRRFSAGLGTGTDKMDFEINRTNLEQDLARIRLMERNTRRELNVLLGVEPSVELRTPAKEEHQHEAIRPKKEFDPATHREIRALDARREGARLTASKERRWWAPSVDAFGSYSLFTFREREYPSLQDRVDAVVGARVTLNLFDGGSSIADATAAEREGQALEAKTAQSRRELQARVQSSLDELALIHELVHGAEKNVEQSRTYLRETFSEYKRGLKNSPDVFSANQRYLDAQRRYAELRRDYQFARVEIQNLYGE